MEFQSNRNGGFHDMAESDQFLSEWNAAQDRYRAGVNAGYDDSDADQMYLAPVRDKWNIMQKVPEPLKQQASWQLDDAHISFLKGIQAGYKANDAADLYLKPEQEKWQLSQQFKNESDPEADAKLGIEAAIQGGLNPVYTINTVPGGRKAMADPRFATRVQTWAHEAEAARQKKSDATNAAQIAAAKGADPDVLYKKMFSLEGGMKTFIANHSDAAGNLNTNAQGMVDFLKSKDSQIANALTNAPTILGGDGKFRFQPPADAGQPTLGKPAQAQSSGPTNADLVADQHPGWSAAQIDLGASGKLKGATTIPDVGEVRKGYRFKGGSPADKSNWEPVQQ